ncbi:hypothetical protein SAMN04487965_3689 [Microbulbifer donghaiensis]|uniref:Uncharacterized protein n=1 Tax=Microbulbifer donghaiensis TaxID=494016 RepID=A0A1M5IJP2_9GAMM|nr:hypothetical protein [Microbulbifer donghaiensis]SHG28522.1 hypothetical protein SAMN04487965_3689 [Microbulbifer donghaiensis]
MAKVTDIRDKKPRKPISVEDSVKRAHREHFKKTPIEKEPKDLASGKTREDGKMVADEDDEDGQ